MVGCKTLTYVRPTVKNPNIIVGDFTYFSDTDFEKHVLHHYYFYVWDKEIHEIQQLIPLLTDSNIEYVKMTLKNIINESKQIGACSSTGKNG